MTAATTNTTGFDEVNIAADEPMMASAWFRDLVIGQRITHADGRFGIIKADRHGALQVDWASLVEGGKRTQEALSPEICAASNIRVRGVDLDAALARAKTEKPAPSPASATTPKAAAPQPLSPAAQRILDWHAKREQERASLSAEEAAKAKRIEDLRAIGRGVSTGNPPKVSVEVPPEHRARVAELQAICRSVNAGPSSKPDDAHLTAEQQVRAEQLREIARSVR